MKMDVILRYCGSGDWLGIVEIEGLEVYRSGVHRKGKYLALTDTECWMSRQGDLIDSIVGV